MEPARHRGHDGQRPACPQTPAPLPHPEQCRIIRRPCPQQRRMMAMGKAGLPCRRHLPQQRDQHRNGQREGRGGDHQPEREGEGQQGQAGQTPHQRIADKKGRHGRQTPVRRDAKADMAQRGQQQRQHHRPQHDQPAQHQRQERIGDQEQPQAHAGHLGRDQPHRAERHSGDALMLAQQPDPCHPAACQDGNGPGPAHGGRGCHRAVIGVGIVVVMMLGIRLLTGGSG